MTLMIVSHTPHFIINGQIVGWSATIREINQMSVLFDRIYHLAPMNKGEGKESNSVSPYVENVCFVELPEIGGRQLFGKVLSAFAVIRVLRTVTAALRMSDIYHLRLPTSYGLFLIPFLVVFTAKKGWFKYAGNWVADEMPPSYRIQKWMLERQKKVKVTINGLWPGQRKHVLTFENPCLTEYEVTQGKQCAELKSFSGQLTILFVGRLDNSKGVDRIVEALNVIDCPNDIEKVIFIGEGDYKEYEELNRSGIKFSFEGGLSREEVNEFYKESHILLLPSLSEGFPKVVAEAAAFGCVPAVSNVSAISQYVDASNGLVFRSLDPKEMALELNELILNRNVLRQKSVQVKSLAWKFTYSYYLDRLKREVLI